MTPDPARYYEIELTASAAKEYRSLPDTVQKRVCKAVDELQVESRPAGCRKLAGHRTLFRIRVGAYRVIYDVNEKEKCIKITVIRHRKDAYR